ncbi:DNA-binding protein [bacterium]|nr:DNA-binding protein [bacterium]
MKVYSAELQECYLVRLDMGSDLLEALEELAGSLWINMGTIELIGAVSQATIGFYNQQTQAYEMQTFERELEIVSCIGNISVRDGRPVIHAHIALADQTGQVFGGHLMHNTRVFAVECKFMVMSGEVPTRTQDPSTNLYLWNEEVRSGQN